MSGPSAAPTSDIQIANMALLAAGARSTIAAFNEKSTEARYANMYYAQTRDSLLRGAHWNFARSLKYLTLLLAAPGTPENTTQGSGVWRPGVDPQPPYAYEYEYPPDCELMRYISPQLPLGNSLTGIPLFSVPSWMPWPNVTLQPQKFQVGLDAIDGNQKKVVLTNQETAIAVYTTRVTNMQLWDPMFADAMISALASRLVIPLSGKAATAKALAGQAMNTLMEARKSDGNEGITFTADTTRPPDWIRIRGYAGDWATGSYYTMAWSDPPFLLL